MTDDDHVPSSSPGMEPAGGLAEGPPPPAVRPHDVGELRAVFSLPFRVISVVLSEQERLARTIASGGNGVLLVGVLLYTSVLFTLPFGAVLEVERLWRVALLFVGSLGICLPSLLVFSAYVGYRIDLRQNLALGLVITCVAALFTFGFFPILWFLDATMEENSSFTAQHISLILLGFSLLAGIAHLHRCLRRFDGLVASYPILIVCWQALFVYICYRMAWLLELL